MAILRLAPDRCAPLDSFEVGAFAYCFADRGVRRRGVLITPEPLSAIATADGTIEFDLTPASLADDREEFTYTVAAFDPQNRRMWIGNIVMPDEDVEYWSLIPAPMNLDARVPVPFECVVEEPLVIYCGFEPVEPVAEGFALVEGTIEFNPNDAATLSLTHPTGSTLGAAELSGVANDNGEFVVLITAKNINSSGTPVYLQSLTVRAAGTEHDFFDGNDNLPVRDAGSSNIVSVSDFIVGNYYFISADFAESELEGEFGASLYVEDYDYDYTPATTSQADIDAYNAAKAEYDACIASGGIDGDGLSPDTVYCGIEPEPVSGSSHELFLMTAEYGDVYDENTLQFTFPEGDTRQRQFLLDVVAENENFFLLYTADNSNGDNTFQFASEEVDAFGAPPDNGVENIMPVFDDNTGDTFPLLLFQVGQYYEAYIEEDIELGNRLFIVNFDADPPSGSSQADIDAYDAAKAAYDACIANGGIPGEQP